MPPVSKYRRIQARSSGVFLVVSMLFCHGQPLGSASLPNGPFPLPGFDSSGLPLYLITRAGGEGLDQYKAKALGDKLVKKYLVALSGRAKFVNKDYFDFSDGDCEAPVKVCEVIQITVGAAKSSRVTWGIDNKLLPEAPDKGIWRGKEPPSCEISDARPATECEDHMLHVLAGKLLVHDETEHRGSSR